MVGSANLREKASRRSAKRMRCAIYTRKSSEEGLEQAFNSLDAQREACAAFILSQKHEGQAHAPADRRGSDGRANTNLPRAAASAARKDGRVPKTELPMERWCKARFWASDQEVKCEVRIPIGLRPPTRQEQ
jgi:hypothetical protein